MRSTKGFGELLASLRVKAGFRSQEEAVSAMKTAASGTVLSKSVLSLYERGAVTLFKPEVLKLLASVYGVSYSELANTWFSECYSLKEGPASDDKARGSVTLVSDGETSGANIITADRHLENQKQLSASSEVSVVSTNFVDSDGPFFHVVSGNIRRGIVYHYLLPDDARPAYEAFVLRLARTYPDLKGRKLTQRVRFIPRPLKAFPVSYVLYLHPAETLEGFVALPEQRYPRYYLVADTELSLSLLESFRWAVSLAEDTELKRSLVLFQFRVEEARRREQGRSFAAYRLETEGDRRKNPPPKSRSGGRD